MLHTNNIEAIDPHLRSENHLTLTDTEKYALFSELARVQYDPNGSCEYISEVRFIAMRTLPRRVLKVLNCQKSSLRPHPYIIINNLPVDKNISYVPHPMKYDALAKSGSVSENVAVAIAALIGEPYSIEFEGGEIVNNLIPTTAGRLEFTGLGSEVELDFHIENAALKSYADKNYSPLGLLLAGVNYDPDGPLTRVADARLALSLLSFKQKEILSQNLFKIKVPYRWRVALGNKKSETKPMPLIKINGEYPDVAVAFYPDMVNCLTTEARSAFEAFHHAVKISAQAFAIKPGSLIYIDNRIALHARDKFNPTFNGGGISSRWVQRVFVAPNLWNYRSLEQVKNRVFKPVS